MRTIKTSTPDVGQDVRSLRNDELDAVAGASVLSDTLNTVIKAIGEGLGSVARKG